MLNENFTLRPDDLRYLYDLFPPDDLDLPGGADIYS